MNRTEITAEEREAIQAKRDAQRQAIVEARREEARLEDIRAAAGRSAAINRWTGKPHEHRREKDRRLLAACIKQLGLTRSTA